MYARVAGVANADASSQQCSLAYGHRGLARMRPVIVRPVGSTPGQCGASWSCTDVRTALHASRTGPALITGHPTEIRLPWNEPVRPPVHALRPRRQSATQLAWILRRS